MVTLDIVTRRDASGDFFGLENVPRRAITMGVGTIMKAKKIILMAWVMENLTSFAKRLKVRF